MSEKRKLRTKNKTTRTSKGTRARNGEKKAYLELVEVQNNLKLAEIKKNKIAGSSNSLSDNNSNDREDILENDIASKKYNPVQSYDRSFRENKLAKNLYQVYQIPVDNKK